MICKTQDLGVGDSAMKNSCCGGRDAVKQENEKKKRLYRHRDRYSLVVISIMEKNITEMEVEIIGGECKAGCSDKASMRNHLRKDATNIKEGVM